MSESRVVTVSTEEAHQRLDVFLSRRLEQFSRSALQRWIESGHVTVHGERCKPNYQVKAGEEIQIAPPPQEPLELTPEPIPLKIVYEDRVLVVVDKPAGMVVHPGAGNRQGTLANALLHHFQVISRAGTIRPGIVHRLDKSTSGVMVVAKNDQAHEFLADQFKARKVEKRYLTLLHGRLREREGTVDVALGRDPRARTRMSTRGQRSRSAVTRYQVIRYYPDLTYVEVFPLTGRTHQIRVHFQHLGHPVVGDETYGKRSSANVKDPGQAQAVRNLGRTFLHAAFLAFLHPETQERVFFESSLPEELAQILSALG